MRRFVCLAYHRICNDPSDPYAVSPRRFEAQMGLLTRLGYRVLGATQALTSHDSHSIALTFDDGTRDFADTAWPLLHRLGFGATLFVVSRRVGRTASWPGGCDAPLLDAGQIAALAAAGVEIGAHGTDHRRFSAMPDEELAAELQQTYAEVTRITGAPPTALAYPYGDASPAAAEAARAAGFASGWTARGGSNHAGTLPMALRRTLVMSSDTGLHFAIKVLTGYARFVEWKMDARRIP